MAEQDLVELVDDDGRATGSITVGEAHQAPGRRHRAFSVVVLDRVGGRVLLQRRAEVKLRFAGAWANACCGHVPPGGDPATSARRRLVEELGLVADERFREAGIHVYDAPDAVSGMVECEYDHVLVLEVEATSVVLEPDPAEVSEVRWMPVEVVRRLAGTPQAAPWLAGVLAVAVPAAD
ncbi:isopentenyl-diphosphate Delta-isomerase [Nocardioides sp.]|uniref:isopentenyl-diphosphate Delta-isomerase n=1 Tax=Nocardioides sp. TaxID=35761 RepID=UPI0035163C5D